MAGSSQCWVLQAGADKDYVRAQNTDVEDCVLTSCALSLASTSRGSGMLVVVPAAVSSNAGSLADSELVAGREVKLPWAGCAFEEAIWSWTLGLESARRCKGSKHLGSALCQCLLTWKDATAEAGEAALRFESCPRFPEYPVLRLLRDSLNCFKNDCIVMICRI
jgi:hypothetical protein